MAYWTSGARAKRVWSDLARKGRCIIIKWWRTKSYRNNRRQDWFCCTRRGCEGMADCIHRASQGFRLDIQTWPSHPAAHIRFPPRPRTTSTTFPTPTPPPLLKGPSPLTLLVLATTLTSQIGSRKSSAKSWGVIRPTWYNQRTRLRFLRCGLEVARQEGGTEAREVQPSLAGRRSGGMAQTAPNGE